MSHLGELLSALVDGELSGAELDRANAHVAACGACRVEANALRRLKHELRSLAEVSDADDITKRLLALAGQADQDPPVPVRYLDRERGRRRQPPKAGRQGLSGPFSARRRLIGRRRGRYVLWSTVSLVVVGIGTAFGMGGGSSATGPQITPQLEVFDVQHAIYSGDVPFADPTDVSTRVPVGAATP
ncbi:MAG TPA: zf-HC2 domain-containing protein [Trebonia sp.]|nr:zf-HC2 domain-containing protein [Trebonia sp.]